MIHPRAFGPKVGDPARASAKFAVEIRPYPVRSRPRIFPVGSLRSRSNSRARAIRSSRATPCLGSRRVPLTSGDGPGDVCFQLHRYLVKIQELPGLLRLRLEDSWQGARVQTRREFDIDPGDAPERVSCLSAAGGNRYLNMPAAGPSFKRAQDFQVPPFHRPATSLPVGKATLGEGDAISRLCR